MTQPLFIIDSSALIDMFEGKDSSKKLMDKFNELKYAGNDPKAITTTSNFLRAIFLTDPETKIKDIQKTLNFLVVHPSSSDFKNEKAVMNEILEIAKIFGGK